MYATELPPWLVRAAALMFGAVWGSFFNVAIYRWPREMSVVTPPSHCPACSAPVRPHQNIPIFGWLALRGRAACCGAKLSVRYPLVELLSAVLCVALAERYLVSAEATATLFDASLVTVLTFAFVGGLLIITFVDLEWMEIPDEVSLPCAALGLATATIRPEPGPAAAAIGAGAGFLVVQVVFVWAYERVTGRRGMGEGDAKLLLMIGAFLGWQGAIFAIVAGAFQGLVTTGALMATGRQLAPPPTEEEEGPAGLGEDEGAEPGAGEGGAEAAEADDEDPAPEHIGHVKVPYGPFLALGALEFLFFGDHLVAWYMTLFE